MNFLEDWKKKGQTFVQNAGTAANKAANNLVQTVQNTGNAANNAVRNVYNTAVQGANNVKSAIDQGARNVQNAAAGQPTNDDTAWVEEYNQFNAENSSPTTVPTAATAPTTESTTTSTNANAGASASTTPQDVTQNPQWQAELDGIMNQILNREKFSYDMNGDAMYQQYADIYQNQANLGMENAMAQNAALTGGYGSSYGQMVGQQAYAQQMQGLNEVGMDLYDRAYQQYMDEGDQLAQQYAMVAEREGELYDRAYRTARDAVADNQWNAMNGAYEFDENGNIIGATGGLTLKLQNDAQDHESSENALDREHDSSESALDREHTSTENALDRSHASSENALDREHDSSESALDREHDSSESALDREHDSSESALDREHDSSESALDREHDSSEKALDREQEDDELGFFYGAEFDENGNIIGKTGEGYYDEQAKAAAEANNPNTTYEGEGVLNGQEVPKQLANVPGLTTTNPSFFDENGQFKQAAVVAANENGSMTYNIGGKEVRVKAGTNPYTNSVNPDAKGGTFDNGYQPDNIGGEKLEAAAGTKLSDGSEAPEYDIINGIKQNVYKTKDGQCWIWDDTANEYLPYGEPYKEKSAGGMAGGPGGKLEWKLKQ